VTKVAWARRIRKKQPQFLQHISLQSDCNS
jgi:hypothetical protein